MSASDTCNIDTPQETRPFKDHRHMDVVTLGDSTGTVEDVTLRVTRLRAVDGTPIVDVKPVLRAA